MADVDIIKNMNLWNQDCEDVEVSEIDRGDHIVEKDKYESNGDKEEVEKDDEQNLIQGYEDENKSETENFTYSETKLAADFRTEDLADSKTVD